MKRRGFTLLGLSLSLILLTFLLSGKTQSIMAQTNTPNVELIGQIGGATYAVAVQGSYAFIGVGPRLIILDISNPAQPTVVGRSNVFSGLVESVAVAGDFAYIADGYGLRIINIVNLTAPTQIGSFDMPGQANDVVVVGDYVYVTNGSGGLSIIDVTDPAAPTEVGFHDTPGWANGVAVAGSYAYVADGSGSGLRIINVANPANPIPVGFYDTPGNARDVTIVGSYAYIADDYSGLRIINVANPANPIPLGFYDTPGYAIDVTIVGSYAYVANDYNGLRIINVANPAAPTSVGFYDTPGRANNVAMVGGYAYVADAARGLRIINVANPAAPTQAGFFDDTPGYAEDVVVVGNYAYIAARDSGLRIINVADPAAPTQVGFYDTPGDANSIAVVGGYAYVADGSGLRIINVANPTAPTQVGFYGQGGASSVAVAGNYAYVADGRYLRVINVANATAPFQVGSYFAFQADFIEDVVVIGNYAYLAESPVWIPSELDLFWGGLRVVDISNPAAPTAVGFYDTPDWAGDVAVAGNYAYVADGSGLYIINVANPTIPTKVGAYYTPGVNGVALAGNYAYVTKRYFSALHNNIETSLNIIDVTDPAAPTEAGFHITPGFAVDLAGVGNYAYIADTDGWLLILRYVIDRDEDGLPDHWEVNGHNGIDLPAMGADPDHKDIFVEVDYMEEQVCVSNLCQILHSHRPKSDAIAIVVEAFKNAPVGNPDNTSGINLHVDFGPDTPMTSDGTKWDNLSDSNPLPHDDYLTDWEFATLKQTNFSAARSGIFHYAIFAHHYLAPGTTPCTSGRSFGIGGVDFIVSLAGWGNWLGVGECEGTQVGRFAVGTSFQQAGTFMHELGHNLGLGHGGGDSITFKPNYLSVMNYAFQTKGLIYGGNEKPGRFDYSRSDQIPNLVENSLNETIGLNGGSSTAQYGTRWTCPDKSITSTLAANDPVNWNCIGNSNESNVSANINNTTVYTSPTGETLTGYFDWQNLVYNGSGIIGSSTTTVEVTNNTVPPELTLEQDNLIPDPYAIALTGPGGLVGPRDYTTVYTFTIGNIGDNDDNYFLSATSSLGWANLATVPNNIWLASGTTHEFAVSVTIPSTSNATDVDVLRITATSAGNPALWASHYVRTAIKSPTIYLPIILK